MTMPETRHLLYALAALLVLTLSSWGLAHLPTGAAGAPIAFTIAIAKALVVLLVFMELRVAGTVAWSAVVVAFLLIVLLAAGAWSDVAFR
jgi:caa(3)-type oxidase subunit IV